MAASGFEGFEKRLELHFSGDDPATLKTGLRNLPMDLLQGILSAVQCTIVSSVGNRFFDSYVLSESSLFIYPTKIIIKTCGTTQLLKSIRPLIACAADLGLTPYTCRYTRGSFIFPKAQPFPHSSFKDEVFFLENDLPATLCFRKASILTSVKVPSHTWHVFTASTFDDPQPRQHLFTVEVCMTGLDRVMAKKFFWNGGSPEGMTGEFCGDVVGKEITRITKIDEINPNSIVCDFGFEPCGYSMNGIEGDRYSTIHVTPEDGFSYASYECVGSVYDGPNDIVNVLRKAVEVFRPATVSVATTGCDLANEVWTRVAQALEPLGLKCRSCTVDEFPAAGSVVYQTFSTRRKK